MASSLNNTIDLVHHDLSATPYERLKLANEVGMRGALEFPVRQFAGELTAQVSSIPDQAPKLIAEWLRENIRYQQSPPMVEILQGPYHTLQGGFGDCDDLAITWMALTRALGLSTYVLGIALTESPEDLQHAIGYDAGSGICWELTNDERYTGTWTNDVHFHWREDMFGVFYSNEPGETGYHEVKGGGMSRQRYTRTMKGCLCPTNTGMRGSIRSAMSGSLRPSSMAGTQGQGKTSYGSGYGENQGGAGYATDDDEPGAFDYFESVGGWLAQVGSAWVAEEGYQPVYGDPNYYEAPPPAGQGGPGGGGLGDLAQTEKAETGLWGLSWPVIAVGGVALLGVGYLVVKDL